MHKPVPKTKGMNEFMPFNSILIWGLGFVLFICIIVAGKFFNNLSVFGNS